MEQFKAPAKSESCGQQLLPVPTATAPVFDSTRLATKSGELSGLEDGSGFQPFFLSDSSCPLGRSPRLV